VTTEPRPLRGLADLLRDVVQLAYVTDDIDAATAWFEGTLGTTRCHTRYQASMGGLVTVDGVLADEWVMDVALVNAGATNLEIIRPVSGAVDLYRDAIRPGAPATFHHIGVRVDDFDEATALIEGAGRTWSQYGGLADSVLFGYVDLTAELGHHVEVMQIAPGFQSYLDKLRAESDQ
jgi:hypothetical protein